MTELPSDTSYLPDEVTYGFVADRIILSVGDTRYDGDRFPDGVPANGIVRFIPAQTQFYTKEEPATVLPQEIQCTIYNRNHPVALENGYDSNLAGKLVDPAGHVGNVALVVGRYHVTYQLDTGQPHRVTIDVKTTHTNENPLWIPEEAELRPLPTERFVVNERVYRETAEARNEAVEAAGNANDWALLAEEMYEATKALGITVDTSVGTRIFVGDTLISATTGLRDVTADLINGWTGSFFVEREGPYVYFRGRLEGENATSDVAYELPEGFRPGFLRSTDGPHDYGNGTVAGRSNNVIYRLSHYMNRFQIVGADGASGGVEVNHMVRTTHEWPTSLPGVQARDWL